MTPQNSMPDPKTLENEPEKPPSPQEGQRQVTAVPEHGAERQPDSPEVVRQRLLEAVQKRREKAVELLECYETEVVTPERLPEVMPALLRAEEECYPEDMRDGAEHIQWIVDKGPLIVVRNRGTGEVVGYMSSARGTHLTELDPEDPDFFGDEQETAQYCTDDTLYVWNVSIVPRHRNQSVFSTLLYPSTIQEAARNGYRKIVFHSRQSENLTPMYEQKYGARRIRQVDDWFPTLPEEKFDLVEIDLDPATNPRIEETLLLSLKNPTRAERERHELDRRLNGLQENYARKRSEGRGKGGVPRHPDEIAIDVARLMIRAQSAGVDIAPFQDRWRRMEPEIRARYETWQSTGERTDGPIQLAT